MTKIGKTLDVPRAEIFKLISLLDAGKNEEVLKLLKPLTKKFAPSSLLYFIAGSANQSLSRLDSTIENYRKALKLDPNLTPAYSNLGTALADKGDVEAAMECYRSVVALDPNHEDVHFNIGSLQLKMGDTDLAMASFNNALAVKPNHFDAKNSMGFIFIIKEEYLAAIECFEQAIEFNPGFFVAYKNLGDALHRLEKYDSAITNFQRAIELNPKFAEAYFSLGNTYQGKGEIEKAIANYDLALKHKPSFVDAYYNLGTAYLKKGDCRAAISFFDKVVDIKSNDELAYRQISVALTKISITKYESELADITQKLLNQKSFFWPVEMVYPVIKIIKINPNFKNLLTMSHQINHGTSAQKFLTELLKFPLLEQIITICQVPDSDISELLEKAREALIVNLAELEFDTKSLRFYSALAAQCFINEYIFEQSEWAGKAVLELERGVEQNIKGGRQPPIEQIFALASFKPLHKFSWITDLSENEFLNEILDLQVVSVKKERKIRESLPILGNISNETSLAVQSQYEENPYPRWIYTQLEHTSISISTYIQASNLRTIENKTVSCMSPNILIAGCGTGQHAIQVASLFKDSHILAVDISANSLAYAKRKTEELGISTIEYMQADILSLSQLDQKFEIVECSGVLHHMKSPMAGWENLKGLLKPGGLMRIGLYSSLARKHIRKLREEITKLNVGTDAESLKSFRQTIMNSQISHRVRLRSVMDLYSLSEFRDLLFHVEEHQFSIPQIAECLAILDLSFCGFVNEKVIHPFEMKYGDPNDLYDLQKWDAFEKDNPDIFANMYQFWCQKAI
tara:strand:- start:1971 stop:4373 length:2403 start_codon:yes stop_codon:yes gene_type:complete